MAAFCWFFALALLVYWPLRDIRPLQGDNLYVLAWVHQAPVAALLSLDPVIYPEWRPLAFFTIWLEYRLLQLEGFQISLLVNLTIWSACAWLVYRISRELGGVTLAAVAAGTWLLVDQRALHSLSWLIERQSSLACLFGLLALWVLTRARQRRVQPREAAAIGVLLLAAGLSKEYGLAFALAIAVYASLERQPRALASALAALAAYGTARLVFAGGAWAAYCEEVGFFTVMVERCFEPTSLVSLGQMAYNVVAAVIGTAVPGVFNPEGAFAMSRAQIVYASGMLVLAGAGLRYGGRMMRVLALIPLANGLLGFLVYRERNQIVGVCAIAIAAGVGASLWTARDHRPYLRTAIAAFVVAVILIRVVNAHLAARLMEVSSRGLEPCESWLRKRPFGDRYARIVGQHYGLPNPGCDGN